MDKIEEYRANEEALNMAILSAQKLAVQIESEARQRAAAMIEDAERQVKAKVGSIQEQTAAEERRLADAQTAAKIFLDKAKEDKVEYNEEQYQHCLPIFKTQLKATIARLLWGMNAYYQVIQELDESVQRAVVYMETGQ